MKREYSLLEARAAGLAADLGGVDYSLSLPVRKGGNVCAQLTVNTHCGRRTAWISTPAIKPVKRNSWVALLGSRAL
jgi:hypothetical protein